MRVALVLLMVFHEVSYTFSKTNAEINNFNNDTRVPVL